MHSKLKLTFYGGVGTATGANIMLEFGSKTILVDCGLLQGSREEEEKNIEPFKYDPKQASFLIVTHAHLDHIGKIPKLIKEGFQGRIISTEETREIARPMLEDALRVWDHKHPARPLFSSNDLEKTFELWEGHKYHEKVNLFNDPLAGEAGCNILMKDAGHVLGSAIVEVTCGQGNNQTKIAFTGDLGNSPSPLLPDTEPVTDVDYIVMESVYGDRNHPNKIERKARLKEAILNGIKRGGTIIIPAFSIERTQVLLYEINNMVEDGEIPSIPVYLDSPLAEKVTEIYRKYKNNFKEEIRKEIKAGDDIFDFPKLKIVKTHDDSVMVEGEPNPKIIMAGSGMSQGGRVVNHEMNLLGGKENTIILVGYQAIGTLGRQLEEGLKEITPPNPPLTSRGGQERGKINVRAKIESIKGYSSHKDSDNLLEFVANASESLKLKKVFVIMGEPKSSLFLVQRIRDYIGTEATYPEPEKEYPL